MAYAKTIKGAKERVRMKRAIRKAGGTIQRDATTDTIRKRYKKYVLNK